MRRYLPEATFVAIAICVIYSSGRSLSAAVLLADGSPDPNEASLRLWLDAAVGVTHAGGAVSDWADRSVTGKDFAQTSAGNRPTLVDNVPLLNNNPAVRFDGTSTYMLGPSSIYTAGPSTAFIVAQASDPGLGSYDYFWDTAGSRHEAFLMNNATPSRGFGYDISGRIYNHAAMPFDGRYVVYSAVADGASSFTEIDGAARVNGSMGGGANGTFYLSKHHTVNSAYYDGHIAEILIYNQALSDTDYQAVEDYLQEKYRTSASGYVLSSGLAGYWDFDDPLNASGKFGGYLGGEATPVDNAYRDTADAALGAGSLEVDGEGDYVTLSDMTSQFTDAGTLSMWVKLDVATPPDPRQTGFATTGAGINSHYPYTNGRAYFSTFLASGRVDYIDLTAGPDREEWHLLTITRDGTGTDNWLFYQNGQLMRADSPAAAFFLGTAPWIGATNSERFLDGHLDDLALFNRALMPGEVKALYSLATHADLGYDLGSAAELFGLYQAGSGSVTINGQQWVPFSGSLTGEGDLLQLHGCLYLQINALGGLMAVPEPATLLLLALGLPAFALCRPRRRRR